MFNNEITEAILSKVLDSLFKFIIEENIEQISIKKYQTSNSIITGKFVIIITIMTNTPRVFFIIRKLLSTEETASPTPPPTIGTTAPETNLIPRITTLSDETASTLWVVNSPVKTVENSDRTMVTNLFTVLSIFSFASSCEMEEIILKIKIDFKIGNKIFSAEVVIIDDKKIVYELYVKANEGLRDAIITAHIIGKYPLTKMKVVLIEEAAS